LDRNSIVDSNGSRLFSAGRPLGTRKNSIHCLWFQTLHRTPFGTSSYFTHMDVCFDLLITALLCKFRNQRQWIEFFLVPKGRPAEKSLDPLLSTMEFRSNSVKWYILCAVQTMSVLGQNSGTFIMK
jgi:hypothetical protein